MLRFPVLAIFFCTLNLTPVLSLAQERELLGGPGDLELVNVSAKTTEYNGKRAINLTGTRQQGAPDVRGNRPASRQPRGETQGQQRGESNREQRASGRGGPGGMRQRPER